MIVFRFYKEAYITSEIILELIGKTYKITNVQTLLSNNSSVTFIFYIYHKLVR